MTIRKILDKFLGKKEEDKLQWVHDVPSGGVRIGRVYSPKYRPEAKIEVMQVDRNSNSVWVKEHGSQNDPHRMGFDSLENMINLGLWKYIDTPVEIPYVNENLRKIIKEEVDDFDWTETPNYVPIEDFVSCRVCDGDYVRVRKREGVDFKPLKYITSDGGDNILEDGEYEIYRNNMRSDEWIELVGPKGGHTQQYSFFVDKSEMDDYWFEQIPSPYDEEELNESEFDWVDDHSDYLDYNELNVGNIYEVGNDRDFYNTIIKIEGDIVYYTTLAYNEITYHDMVIDIVDHQIDNGWWTLVDEIPEHMELNESEFEWAEDTPIPQVYVGMEFTESPKYYENADDTIFTIETIEEIESGTIVWVMGDGLDGPVDIGIEYVIDGLEKGEYLPVD
jgi:hypothetical protein